MDSLDSLHILFVREYNEVEGPEFWRINSIIGTSPYKMKEFWKSYPVLENPLDIFKENKVLRIKNLENDLFLIKIEPKIGNTISSGTKHQQTIYDISQKFFDYNSNKKIFFTMKSYDEVMKDKVKAYNEHYFKLYSFQPEFYNVDSIRFFPLMQFLDESKILGSSSNLGDTVRSLIVQHPPIRIDKFQNLPLYEQKKIVKNWTKKKLDPLNEYKTGFASPMFLNPKYVLMEFSKFYPDENEHLKKIKVYFERSTKQISTRKEELFDIMEYIDHLTDSKERSARSKLDSLVNYIKFFKRKFYKLKLIKFILGYRIVTKDEFTQDGLYILREDGVVKQMIYHSNFRKVYFFVLNNNSQTHYIDVRKIFDLIVNFYVYSNENHFHVKLDGNYIVFNNEGWQVQKNIDSSSMVEMKMIDPKDKKEFVIAEKLFFVKKRYYYSDKIPYNILYTGNKIVGTVRCGGICILYILRNK